MICPVCGGEMQALLVKLYCPWCEMREAAGVKPREGGFIIWRGRPPGSCEYVFKTQKDAELWRDAAGLKQFSVRQIMTDGLITWRQSSGTCPDILLADHLYEVYERRPMNPTPNDAWLVE